MTTPRFISPPHHIDLEMACVLKNIFNSKPKACKIFDLQNCKTPQLPLLCPILSSQPRTPCPTYFCTKMGNEASRFIDEALTSSVTATTEAVTETLETLEDILDFVAGVPDRVDEAVRSMPIQEISQHVLEQV